MFAEVARWIAVVIEVAGIAAITLGVAVASYFFVRKLVVTRSFGEAYPVFRSDLGRSILVGLELLVAADIVGTVVVDPTFENLGVLAIIVGIRIALSFAMEVEIEGHWPLEADRALAEGGEGRSGVESGRSGPRAGRGGESMSIAVRSSPSGWPDRPQAQGPS